MSIGELLTSPDWGTVPDWLGAFGTVSAVAWALHLGRRDGKRLDEERVEAKNDRESAAADRALFRRQQEAEAEAQKRRLAAKVTLVVEPIRAEAERYIKWTVHNGGDEPISMATVVRRVVPEGDNWVTPPVQLCHTWPSIEPGGSRTKTVGLFDALEMREGELQFTDGTGQRWQRMEFGRLRSLDSGDPEAVTMAPIQR